MHRKLEKITQTILDSNHEGKKATQVIHDLHGRINNPESSIVEHVCSWVHDSFAQVNLDGYQGRVSPLRINTLLNELVYRVLSHEQLPSLVDELKTHAEVSQRMVRQYESLQRCEMRIEKKPEYRMLIPEVKALVEHCRSIEFPYYQASKVMNLLYGEGYKKIRDLVFPERAQTTSSIKFPISEATLTRLANEKELVSSLSDKDLGIRLTHALKNHALAKYDPDYPVYGVDSIYVLTPWAISLCIEKDVSFYKSIGDHQTLAIMNKACEQIDALLKRYERIQSSQRTNEMEP